MTVTKITLFDIPTTLPVPTSPNTWKVRIALNFKGLHYTTRWVETADIETVCSQLGIPPTSTSPSGAPKYTLPALIDETRSTVKLSDSTPIITYLESTYPDPDPRRALYPADTRALQALFEAHVAQRITARLIPVMVMHMYDKKTPRDRADFRRRMEAAFGRPLEDIEFKGTAREEAWRELEGAFDELAVYKEKSGGVYFTGGQFSVADLTLAGIILAMRYDSPDEAWPKLQEWNKGEWKRYMDAFEEYLIVR
ncbi:hypothetical protein CONPUDRAFT_60018 [Coniophora puteana RWD-64-598 SS2]|uniref:GST N-terminal domain-containing protein n=1 Tax=Coniophora puteana (strain RWD-64-598) TaxID=741705 RepID=A0A5M3MI38_CONPW|nr:uncharacterized protein CONPUDRAFT_60018 [Coniophora puteana RWD-64-598 SS2]EIW78908.1 hypothetical protein CONPUDRAFT_60018 [Coniophora puteana RWD-64-598 SS2]